MVERMPEEHGVVSSILTSGTAEVKTMRIYPIILTSGTSDVSRE